MPLHLFPIISRSPGMSDPAGNHKTVWLLALAGAAVALLLGLAVWKLCRGAVRAATAGVAAIRQSFTAEQLTSRFISAIPEITRELNLEVATIEQTETFERSEGKTALWGLLDLGTNQAGIRVPVTYRYHIQLADRWFLEAQGEVLRVQAPGIRASLPPAPHTDGLVASTARGWGRFPPDALLAQLHKEITPTLSLHAQDPRRIALVRESCRASVEAFVRTWVEAENRKLGLPGFKRIEIRFADEATIPPTTSPQHQIERKRLP